MTQYLISFENGAIDFPENDLPEVAEAPTRWSRRRRMPGRSS
jgi:hypothetical protein